MKQKQYLPYTLKQLKQLRFVIIALIVMSGYICTFLTYAYLYKGLNSSALWFASFAFLVLVIIVMLYPSKDEWDVARANEASDAASEDRPE